MKYPVFFIFFSLLLRAGVAQTLPGKIDNSLQAGAMARGSNITQVNDEPFWQEYHEAYPVGKSPEENEARSIAVDKSSNVWVATAAGIYMKKNGQAEWTSFFPEAEKGPAFAVAADGEDVVWMGVWNGVYTWKNGQLKAIPGTSGPISTLCAAKEGVYAVGPDGIWLYTGGAFVKKDYPIARSVRKVITDGKGGIWVASDVGLYHCTAKGTEYFQKTDVLLSAYIKGVALDNDGKIWAGGLGGVTILKDNLKVRVIRPQEGCPSIHVTSVEQATDGTMWIGTEVGVVRYLRNGSHSLRFSRRWLLDDHVNAITFDGEGNAWIATAKGVSAIKKRKMTLDAKQEYFYDVLMKRHIRKPWSAGACRLPNPGDTSTWEAEDDDNDGEFGGNYLAMESFRYAVTKSADAREKAKKGFHFLKMLQEVTNGDGYFARSIVPLAWENKVHDGNRTYTEKEKADELVKEPRFKPVEVRWRKSQDGQWLWKGDASSDEWCGHMLGYFYYYQLAADEEEKKVVREHVSLLLDHVIANNFAMMDIDGTHTRWSVWSPNSLNRDPEWAPDRYGNSMEILAFLKLAFYMTGNKKYQENYLKLINQEHYLENMAKVTQQNPAWYIYYDMIMQAYLFPIFLTCEKDPQLLAFYMEQSGIWMARRRGDKNPLVNFLYSYATHQKEELPASVEFLRDTPLDLVCWIVDHTNREDVRIVHAPVLDGRQVSELPPASIRAVVRWDRNPWEAIDGGPDMEKDPVFWLLPYWMGRYLNMIK
ncbi:ligand-binding sensor domain-containing protein [Flavitalea flava]